MKWVKCGAMPNPNFRVIRPISLRLRKKDDWWIADSFWLNEFGYGKSQTDAMLDFMASIAEFLALSDKMDLGRDLQENLKRIKTFIEPRAERLRRKKRWHGVNL